MHEVETILQTIERQRIVYREEQETREQKHREELGKDFSQFIQHTRLIFDPQDMEDLKVSWQFHENLSQYYHGFCRFIIDGQVWALRQFRTGAWQLNTLTENRLEGVSSIQGTSEEVRQQLIDYFVRRM